MSQETQERLFVKGNEAISRGALAANCRCYFGYPITPQNDIPEFMSKALPAAGGEFVQAESEVASANMILGAAACGIRAMTSSSSPGMSLMQEAISYMAGSELPAVFVNMNRGGPGLGDIGPSQGDYFQTVKGGGHGDYNLLTLAPASCQEAYDAVIEAFDLAFKYRNPVMILGDAILGNMQEPLLPWTPDHIDPNEAADWGLTGAKDRERRLHKSLYLRDGELAGQNRKLQEKFASMQVEVKAEVFEAEDADLIVVAYGSIGRIVKSAVRKLRKEGHKVGLVRPITLFPYPTDLLRDLAKQGKHFLTCEHNTGQMVEDVRLAVRGYADSEFFGHMPGELPVPDDYEQPILDALRRQS
ncbi:MAG: 3-methyl-2-oxobutanoate dehydrogenase subunit VorB [Desulfovibrio sp.]|nr:MAG: 3-methyl-2-oxobutanoate dehydrogenase subunit VorB [Desulfovibrio sp.]